MDIVTKLAKEEAAAEKGAAAAAARAGADVQADSLSGAFDVLELTVSDSPSKGNAAAALKQVCLQNQNPIICIHLLNATFSNDHRDCEVRGTGQMITAPYICKRPLKYMQLSVSLLV